MSNERFGRYELLGVIGEGGMGRVYRAHDEATDRIVALKILPEHFAANESFRERFWREAQVTANSAILTSFRSTTTVKSRDASTSTCGSSKAKT